MSTPRPEALSADDAGELADRLHADGSSRLRLQGTETQNEVERRLLMWRGGRPQTPSTDADDAFADRFLYAPMQKSMEATPHPCVICPQGPDLYDVHREPR